MWLDYITKKESWLDPIFSPWQISKVLTIIFVHFHNWVTEIHTHKNHIASIPVLSNTVDTCYLWLFTFKLIKTEHSVAWSELNISCVQQSHVVSGDHNGQKWDTSIITEMSNGQSCQGNQSNLRLSFKPSLLSNLLKFPFYVSHTIGQILSTFYLH